MVDFVGLEKDLDLLEAKQSVEKVFLWLNYNRNFFNVSPDEIDQSIVMEAPVAQADVSIPEVPGFGNIVLNRATKSRYFNGKRTFSACAGNSGGKRVLIIEYKCGDTAGTNAYEQLSRIRIHENIVVAYNCYRSVTGPHAGNTYLVLERMSNTLGDFVDSMKVHQHTHPALLKNLLAQLFKGYLVVHRQNLGE